MPDRLGTILYDAKIIAENDLINALSVHKNLDMPLGETMIKLGIINKEQLMFGLLKQIEIRKNNNQNLFRLKSLKSLWKELFQYKTKMYQFILYILIANIMTLIFPITTGFFIDNVIVTRNYHLFGVLIIIIMGLYIVKGILFFLSEYLFTDIICQFSSKIKTDLYLFFNRLNFSVFSSYEKGDLLNRVTANVDSMDDYLRMVFIELFTNIPLFIMIFTMMLNMNWIMTLIITPLMFITIFLPSLIANKASPYLDKEKKLVGNLSSFIKEQFSNSLITKLFNKCNSASQSFEKKLEDYFHNMFRLWYYWNISFQVNQILSIFFTSLTLWLGGIFVIDGKLTSGSLVTFYLLLTYMLPGMQSIARVFVRLSMLKVEWGRILDVLKQERHQDFSSLNSGSGLDLKGNVNFHNVTFSYIGSEPIFQKLDLKLIAGKSYGVLGRSGTGKSTLFNILLGLLPISHGTITIDSLNVNQMRQWDISKHIAYMAQDPFLFNGSICDNIKYGALSFYPNISDTEITEAAKKANIHDKIISLPKQYDTIIGEGGAVLSGGETQRLALARAFLKKPTIFIFDEPVASLDPDNRISLMNTILSLKEQTLLISSHDLDLLYKLDYLIVLEDKKAIILSDKKSMKEKMEKYQEVES